VGGRVVLVLLFVCVSVRSGFFLRRFQRRSELEGCCLSLLVSFPKELVRRAINLAKTNEEAQKAEPVSSKKLRRMGKTEGSGKLYVLNAKLKM
jgi:hypothetical protein